PNACSGCRDRAESYAVRAAGFLVARFDAAARVGGVPDRRNDPPRKDDSMSRVMQTLAGAAALMLVLGFQPARAADDDETVGDRARDAAHATGDAVKGAAEATGNGVKRAAHATKRGVKHAARATGRVAKRGAKAVSRGTGHVLHKAGDATKNAGEKLEDAGQ